MIETGLPARGLPEMEERCRGQLSPWLEPQYRLLPSATGALENTEARVLGGLRR